MREALPPPAGEEDAGLSTAEAARRLGIPERTLRRLIGLDQIVAWRILGGRTGSRIRVSAASVDDYKTRFKVRGRGEAIAAPSLSSSRGARRHTAAHKEAVRFINSLGTKSRP